MEKKSSYRKLRDQNIALKNEIDRLMYDISVLIDDEASLEQKFAVKTVHSAGQEIKREIAGTTFTIPGTKYNLLQHIDLANTHIESEEEFTASCVFDSKSEFDYVLGKKVYWLAGRKYERNTPKGYSIDPASGKIKVDLVLTKVEE